MSRSPHGDEHADSRDAPRGLLQLEESRRSFHRQVEQLKDIDDKAMRSVRIAVVVIGFVVTATGITVRNGHLSFGVGPALFTGIGVFFLTVTVIAGVGTSSVTEYKNRLTDAERARLDSVKAGSRRNAELVRIYYSWMEATADQLAEQVAYLTATLFSLVLGVLSLLSAAVLVVMETVYRLHGLSAIQLALLETVTAALVLSASVLATRLSIEKMNPQS